MKTLLIGLSILTVMIFSGVASAQISAEDDAARHFEKGVELYQEGSLDAALVEFERAYELVPSYRLLFNIAQVQTERHEYVTALDGFQRYLDEGAEEIPEPRRLQVEEEMRRLRGRIAELWVETTVEGATLFVNDVRVAQLPLDKRVLINSGIVKIRVEKRGYSPATQVFKVAGGEHPRINLPLTRRQAQPVAATVPLADTPEQTTPPPRRPNRTPFWVSLGATGVLGGATVAFALLTKDANDDLDQEFERLHDDATDIEDARSRVKTFAALTDGFGAGTVVAAGLAIYFLIDPPMKSANRSETAKRPPVRVVPHRSGAVVVGEF